MTAQSLCPPRTYTERLYSRFLKEEEGPKYSHGREILLIMGQKKKKKKTNLNFFYGPNCKKKSQNTIAQVCLAKKKKNNI